MNTTVYEEVINGESTYRTIADELLNKKSVIIGWTDGEYDHRDILFILKPNKYGMLQRGLNTNSHLYISIINFSSMGFLLESDTNNQKYPSYIKAKLRLSDNKCDNKICELINGVIEYIDLAKEK